MARTARTHERRAELVPLLARAFAELGYRRATTAELARRCGVREPILYRLWPDKQAMFVAAIEHVYDASVQSWQALIDASGPDSAAERVLAYEADHHGEYGLYRLLFSGLSECDDPHVGQALQRTYARFARFLESQVAAHRAGDAEQVGLPPAAAAAWAFVGLGTAANIGRELGLLTAAQRAALFRALGPCLLGPRRKSRG